MTPLSLFSSFIDKKQFSFIRARDTLFASLSSQDKHAIFEYACYHGSLKMVQFFYNRTFFKPKKDYFKKLFISVLEHTTNPDVTVLTWLYRQIQQTLLWDNSVLFYLARNLDNRIFVLEWVIEQQILGRSQYNRLLFSLAVLKQPNSMLKILHIHFFQTRWDFLACCLWRLHLNNKNIDDLQYIMEQIAQQWPQCLLHLKKVLCIHCKHKESVRAGVAKMYIIDFQRMPMRQDFQFIFKQLEVNLLYEKLILGIDESNEYDDLPQKI